MNASLCLSMWQRLWWLVVVGLGLSGCQFLASATPTPVTQPETIPITDDAGETLATQTGPLWVVVSGVDEHGLIAEHELVLLSEPMATAVASTTIHTGTAVAVHEIRQTGPQTAQRFYRIEALSGETGWISDYYVRRSVYLFNAEGTSVLLYASAAANNELASLTNVTPVSVKSVVGDWWIVQTADGALIGWVEAKFVKESPEPEFLLNQQHVHP
jgi:hypothetical protein